MFTLVSSSYDIDFIIVMEGLKVGELLACTPIRLLLYAYIPRMTTCCIFQERDK